MFTESTKRAIQTTIDYVAEDAYQLEGRVTKKTLAELALDANRITNRGFTEADKEIDGLIKIHGYMIVLSAAAKLA